MEDKDNSFSGHKVKRLILKEDDVLVVEVRNDLFGKKAVLAIHKQLRKLLLPRTNSIIVIPDSFKLSVIGKEQIKEHISEIDLWNLFEDEDGKNLKKIG